MAMTVAQIIKNFKDDGNYSSVELILMGLWNSLTDLNYHSKADYLKQWCKKFIDLEIDTGHTEKTFGYEAGAAPKYCKLASKAIAKIDGSNEAVNISTFLAPHLEYFM